MKRILFVRPGPAVAAGFTILLVHGPNRPGSPDNWRYKVKVPYMPRQETGLWGPGEVCGGTPMSSISLWCLGPLFNHKRVHTTVSRMQAVVGSVLNHTCFHPNLDVAAPM